MPEDQNKPDDNIPEPSTPRVILGVVIAIVILGGLTYAAYLYSNRSSGAIYPAGYPQNQPPAKPVTIADINCDNPDPNYKSLPVYYIKCDPYKPSAATKWTVYRDPGHGVEFSIPSDLKTSTYPNGLGFPWRTLNPQSNLLVSYEPASSRAPAFKGLTGEDYPKNYWKQFVGLTGLKSIQAYTNKGGVKGWQAIYLYGTDTPTIDTFFEDPSSPGDYVHFSKGVLSDEVYNTLLDSFTWITKTKTAAASPNEAVTPSPTASASLTP